MGVQHRVVFRRNSSLGGKLLSISVGFSVFSDYINYGVSVAEWLACLAQAQKGPGSNRSRDAVG